MRDYEISQYSLIAFANRKKICEEYLAGKHRIEVNDVVQTPQVAREDKILALPDFGEKNPRAGEKDNRGLIEYRPHACCTRGAEKLHEMKTEGSNFETLEKALSDHRARLYILRLYVGGASPKSIEAVKNIKNICEQYLAGKYELSVVDVYQQPQSAAGEQLVAAPALVKHSPLPSRRLIGNLSNTKRILDVLGVNTQERNVAGHG